MKSERKPGARTSSMRSTICDDAQVAGRRGRVAVGGGGSGDNDAVISSAAPSALLDRVDEWRQRAAAATATQNRGRRRAIACATRERKWSVCLFIDNRDTDGQAKSSAHFSTAGKRRARTRVLLFVF